MALHTQVANEQPSTVLSRTPASKRVTMKSIIHQKPYFVHATGPRYLHDTSFISSVLVEEEALPLLLGFPIDNSKIKMREVKKGLQHYMFSFPFSFQRRFSYIPLASFHETCRNPAHESTCTLQVASAAASERPKVRPWCSLLANKRQVVAKCCTLGTLCAPNSKFLSKLPWCRRNRTPPHKTDVVMITSEQRENTSHHHKNGEGGTDSHQR